MTPQVKPLGLADQALSVKVYEELRERIIEGDLAPGTRLREHELAEAFHVSRIPVREALPMLERDGFVRSVPRRGTVVAQFTLRGARELFEVRSCLEVLVAKLAAQRIAAGADGAELRTAMSRADEATRSADPREIAAANVHLHAVLTELADNQLLHGFMESVNGRLQWLFRLTSDRDPEVLCHEHHALVEAVLEGDHTRAEELALAHVESGRKPSLIALAALLPES
jgi:DNA-binding GntR family transcriptional regulator